MKIILLPFVAVAVTVAQDTSALLQTTKQQKALQERADVDGGLSGLEGAITGKKKKKIEKQNVCDKDEANKLFKCFKFGGFTLSQFLIGEEAGGSAVVFTDPTGKRVWKPQGTLSGLTLAAKDLAGSDHAKRQHDETCQHIASDLECMQGNACWNEKLDEVPHVQIEQACHADNLTKTAWTGSHHKQFCDESPKQMCLQITTVVEIKEFLESCHKGFQGKDSQGPPISCSVNLESFVESTSMEPETCVNGTNKVTSEAECERAANRLGLRFHSLKKRFARRPAGCYSHPFKRGKAKDTVYWNSRKNTTKRSFGFRGKNRPAICKFA